MCNGAAKYVHYPLWAILGRADKELDYYQTKVHPTLLQGMDYLAKNGAEVNCYACRMMDQLDDKGQQRNQTSASHFSKPWMIWRLGPSITRLI